MSVGFGIGPSNRGPAGVVINKPFSPEDNLAALREKYCLAGIIQPNPFFFSSATDDPAVIDLTNTPVNSLIVTVVSGTVAIYLGRSPSASIPFLIVTAGVSQQYNLPPHDYIFTVAPLGGAASGNFVAMAR